MSLGWYCRRRNDRWFEAYHHQSNEWHPNDASSSIEKPNQVRKEWVDPMAAEVGTYVLGKLVDLLVQEAVFLHGVTNQVQLLQREQRLMQSFLKDADRKELRDDRVKQWVKEVLDISHDAEDAIETFISRIARQRRQGWIGVVKRFAFFPKELLAQHTIGKEIERINKTLSSISESKSRYGIESLDTAGEGTSSVNYVQEKRRFGAFLGETDPIGLQEEMEMMVGRLIKGESRRCVVSLVGIGGLGKTTLARKIYNSSDVNHFSFRCFVHVSQDCRLRYLFCDIIKCFMNLSEEIQKMEEHELAKKIADRLQYECYLIVLDDIWRKEDWDQLKHAFPENMKGSRVMLTTRIEEVASFADPSSTPYKLRLLNPEESWRLFRKMVFGREDNETYCSPQLANVGKQIVERCGGLPLAIAVLGGLASTKEKAEHAWSNILKNVNRHLCGEESICSQILALSYNELAYYLKPCFLYIGLFPEDTDIPAERLVRYWIAEGLIKDGGKDMEMEDVGHYYLEELINRNMIQVVKRRRRDMRLVKCRIHGLMRDLCIEKSEETGLFEILGGNMHCNRSLANVRRLAVHRSDFWFSQEPITPRLRSLLFMERCPPAELSLGKMRLLRILDMMHPQYMHYSKMHALVHLRYLSLSLNNEKLSFVSSLSNLQVLSVSSGCCNQFSPDALRNMNQLRHLELFQVNVHGLWLGHLCNLQTLCLNSCSGIVKGLQNVTKVRELSLMAQSKLYEEGVSFQHHCRLDYMYLDGPFQLPSLLHELPQNLVELTYSPHIFPEVMILPTLEKLPNLHILIIGNHATGRKIIFSSQGFCRLKVLKLTGLHFLEECEVEEGALPALQRLKIGECFRLKMLPEGLRHVTTLQNLELGVLSEELTARSRENEGDDWYKIRHVPSIIIKDHPTGLYKLLL